MGETKNIDEIAGRLSKDIFKHFLWATHSKTDDNFECVNTQHLGEGTKPKVTHPGDVVFHYDDPYLGKTVYLHTDLKSYAKKTITSTKLRDAFKSLCMTIDCARCSNSWREKYSVDQSEVYEVRGLLFVHNHDNGYDKPFYDAIDKVNLQALPVAPATQLHYFGPHDIQRLYSIANDIIRLKSDGSLPSTYTFYYPDLVMTRRLGDLWHQSATVETLTSPYIIIKYGASDGQSAGYVIYYNAPATNPDEFMYLLDSLSRFQMLESGERIFLRVTHPDAPNDLKSVFRTAQKKYVKAWGFDPTREQILSQIQIERITSVTSTYNPGDMGWKE